MKTSNFKPLSSTRLEVSDNSRPTSDCNHLEDHFDKKSWQKNLQTRAKNVATAAVIIPVTILTFPTALAIGSIGASAEGRKRTDGVKEGAKKHMANLGNAVLSITTLGAAGTSSKSQIQVRRYNSSKEADMKRMLEAIFRDDSDIKKIAPDYPHNIDLSSCKKGMSEFISRLSNADRDRITNNIKELLINRRRDKRIPVRKSVDAIDREFRSPSLNELARKASEEILHGLTPIGLSPEGSIQIT